MSPPKVSVIITTHNRPNLLQRAIRSVLEQRYDNYDLHIVDDASDDNTPQAIETIVGANDQVFYWRHEERRGLSAARNTGIARSDGEYIAFLDDDDSWKPECIAKRVGLLQELSLEQRVMLGVIYCGCEIHMLDENRIIYNLPKIDGDIKEHIIGRDLVTIPSTCMFPRAVLEQVGAFDEGLCSSVDHDIWMKLAVHGYQALAVKKPLVVTCHSKNKRTMVSQTNSRICGVEQYLTKWKPTFNEWFGEKCAKKYVEHYRIRVLGGLGARKLVEGSGHEAACLFRHVVLINNYSVKTFSCLLLLLLRNLVIAVVPAKIIDKYKKIHLKNIQKN